MMATHDPAIDAAVALLAANGYKVSRTRTPRAGMARNAAQGSTLTPVRKTGKTHGHCAAHYRVDGYAQPVCVLGPRMVEGIQYGPQDAAEIAGFAAELVTLARGAGDVLRQIQARDAARAHEQHLAEAAKYDGKTLTGMVTIHVSGGRYIGSASCWGCEKDFRKGLVA